MGRKKKCGDCIFWRLGENSTMISKKLEEEIHGWGYCLHPMAPVGAISRKDDYHSCARARYAVENCLQVLQMLGVLTPEQAEAKTHVENYFKTQITIKKPTLEAFIEPKEMTFENLLNAFIDKPRLKRAQRIKDKELTIQQETDNQVKALIRDYHIVIDLANRLVLHDCADWSRVLPSKRFCKHLGRLLLSLDKEKASNILKQIYANKEAWEFKAYTE